MSGEAGAHVLIVQKDYDIPDAYGPFASVREAQAFAESFRRDAGMPELAEATPENNDRWTELGWLFAIRELGADDPKGPTTFSLSIELGNDAMRTPADVGRVLEKVAGGLVTSGWDGIESGSIRDENGNTVGSWRVER